MYALYNDDPVSTHHLISIDVRKHDADVVTWVGGLKVCIVGFDSSDSRCVAGTIRALDSDVLPDCDRCQRGACHDGAAAFDTKDILDDEQLAAYGTLRRGGLLLILL